MAENKFVALLNDRKPEIQQMLADWVTSERFFAMAMQIQRNPLLANCTPESLVECVLQAAQAGLEIGGQRGHTYPVPYGKDAQLQIGWRGLAFLRLRAGAILSVDTDVVFQGDSFKVGRSTAGDIFEHLADYTKDRTEKNAYAAYARVKLPTGEYQFEVTGKDRIGRHRSHSKQPNGLLWTKFWEEGWRKTPFRILDKRLPEGVNEDAIKRYNMAVQAEAQNWEKGSEFDIEEMPDNPPKGKPKEGNGVVLTPEVVHDDEPEDRLLTDDEAGMLFSRARALKIKTGAYAAMLFEKFNVEDFAELKRSQLEDCGAALEEMKAA